MSLSNPTLPKTAAVAASYTTAGGTSADSAEVRTAAGTLHQFAAIERTGKLAFAQRHDRATRRVAANVLHALAAAVPQQIHAVLTDNGVQLTDALPDRTDPETETDIDAIWAAIWAARGEPRLCRVHAFDHARTPLDIERRLAKPGHPWTKRQAERMNRTLSHSRSVADGAVGGAGRGNATVRRHHHASRDGVRAHLQRFLDACNHTRRLTPPRGLTPCELVCQAWTKEPQRLRHEPLHHTPETEQLGRSHPDRSACTPRAQQ